MTDFFHEPPKNEQKAPPPEKKTTEQERQKRVYTYILILFSAAFVLILWSFLMTNRSNQEVISRLKDSTNILQSTLDENETLEDRIAALEAELEQAEIKLKKSEDAAIDAQKAENDTLNALDWLREIENSYAHEDFDRTASLVAAFEQTGLQQALPSRRFHTGADGNDYPSPAESFCSIVEALKEKESEAK